MSCCASHEELDEALGVDPARPDFDGETYVPARDKGRLLIQLARVKEATADHKWYSLAEISERVGAPQASISARLRDLRKAKFGSYTVERQYVKSGLWQYRVL